jgi:hypothetical protein
MPMHAGRAKHAGASVREPTRQRIFLTFAAGDLALARPVTVRLQAGGGLSLDQALTSEPFAGIRGDIIRASLLTRLRHCTSALCLFGARTLDDEWVCWALEAAAESKLPLLGASLPGESAGYCESILSRLGVEIVPLEREAILSRARSVASHHPARPLDAASIAETLHLMRHPIR